MANSIAPPPTGVRRRRGARAALASLLTLGFLGVAGSAATTHAADVWSSPADLSAPGANATEPQVAADEHGDAVAIWLRNDGSNDIVQASHYTRGTSPSAGTWSAPVAISLPGQSALEPVVEIDDNGNATAAWRRSNGTVQVVQAARYDATSGTWSAPENLSRTDKNARGPELSVDATGNVTAAWYRVEDAVNGLVNTVEAKRYDVGTGVWGATTTLSTPGANAIISRVAADAAGNVIAAWRQVDNGNDIVYVSRTAPTTPPVWSAPKALSAPGQSAATIQLAVAPGGDAMAIWSRSNGTNTIIQTSRYTVATDQWGPAVDVSAAGGNAFGPRVGADAAGVFTAIWRRDNAAGKSIVQASRYSTATSTWSAPVDLSADGRNSLSPRLAVEPNGNVTAVWVRKNAADNFIVQSARLSRSTGTWGAATDLSAPGADGLTPQTDVDGQGNVVAVWARSNGANTIIQASISAPAPGFTPVTPVRVFDTRGQSPNALRTVPVQQIGGATEVRVNFADLRQGATQVTPATGVVAVSLNVAVDRASADGFVTVYPCGTRELVASVNYVKGQTVSNAVIAPLSPTGELCFYAYAPTDVIVDLNGWFPAGSGFNAVTPSRVFDTRGESTNAIRTVPKAQVGPGQPLQVNVASLGSLTPASGIAAVSLNVAVTNPKAAGFITVYPCGDRPFTAAGNYVAKQTVSNAVIAPVSAAGDICFYSLQPTDIVVDINGWFATGSGFTAAGPARVLDTRGASSNAIVTVPTAKVTPANVLRVKVTDLRTSDTQTITPPIGVGAVSLNVAVDNAEADGFVTVYPCGDRPFVASVNYVKGQIVPNAVIAPVSADGYVCFYTYSPTDLIVDVNGWFPTNN